MWWWDEQCREFGLKLSFGLFGAQKVVSHPSCVRRCFVVASALALLILPGMHPVCFSSVCYSLALWGVSVLDSLAQQDGSPARTAWQPEWFNHRPLWISDCWILQLSRVCSPRVEKASKTRRPGCSFSQRIQWVGAQECTWKTVLQNAESEWIRVERKTNKKWGTDICQLNPVGFLPKQALLSYRLRCL